ncbi:MAG: lysophospholipid acyltransferase family protein [bacterium]
MEDKRATSWKQRKKKWKKRALDLEIFPWLGAWLIRFLGLTIRQEWIGREKVHALWRRGQSVIYVFWHGRLLMMPLICRGRRAGVMISHHRDGELITRIIRRFGYYSVRGSSSRDGMAALRRLSREMKAGSDAAIAPDGPRGPRYQAQSGAVLLARLTGCPLIPVAFGTSRGKFLSSWDRFLIPYPFSRGVFIFSDPIWVAQEEGRVSMEEKRQLLEARLNQITKEADHYFDEL